MTTQCDCKQIINEKCTLKLCGTCCTDTTCKIHLEKKTQKRKSKTVTPNIDIQKEEDEDEVLMTCEICKKEYCPFECEIYLCDACNEWFCYDCMPYNRYTQKCPLTDCYYCKYGYCFNNRESTEKYCGDCYVESDSDSDLDSYTDSESDSDSDSDTASYDDVKKILNSDTLDQLEICKYNGNNKTKCTICIICQIDYMNDDEIIKLECDHIYHKECIHKWFTYNYICPYCRIPVGEYIIKIDED
jgi:hypothetical protein